MKRPNSSYTTFMVVAAFAGFGGGNFASSMTNINAFFPQRLKGWALGLNAGGGNMGVAVIQLVGLLVIARSATRTRNRLCHLPCRDRLGRDLRRAVHGQPRHSAVQPWRDGRSAAVPRLLGDELPLHRHLRLLHRVLLRVRSGAADQLPRRWRQCRAGRAARGTDRIHRPAARLDRPAFRRQAVRPHRRRQGHDVHLHHDDLRRRNTWSPPA